MKHEPVMLSVLGGPADWPHYFDLKVGDMVRVHTGEEGMINAVHKNKLKKYHVLMTPTYGGQYGAWEVTPTD